MSHNFASAKAFLTRKYGRNLLKEIRQIATGELRHGSLIQVAKKYGFTEGRAHQILRALYPEAKVRPKKTNQDYRHRPLEGCDRGNIKGFKRYFSQRPGLFAMTYGVDYSPEKAEQIFSSLL